MGYKRWLILTIIGSMLLGLGAAVLVLDYYRTTTNQALVPILAVLSLRFLDRPIRFLLFGGLGLAMILIGIWGANRSLLRPFEKNGKPVWDTLKNYRQREKGIKVVVIGGGHGLAALLRGLKEYTHNITAIVTVATWGFYLLETSATAFQRLAAMKRCFPRFSNIVLPRGLAWKGTHSETCLSPR